jgi:hypothetical protein
MKNVSPDLIKSPSHTLSVPTSAVEHILRRQPLNPFIRLRLSILARTKHPLRNNELVPVHNG